jgi:uncharacterized radical SAM protein YgiQ
MRALGWDQCDIILVSGDAYIDSPFMGVAVVGRVLEKAGYKVGIVAQPQNEHEIAKLGEPRLFWGVSGGSVDSMVSNYTASKKFRHNDAYTPGGKNTKRPDRASIVYTNLIRRAFKPTVPIMLGGIEASLRRTTHYDFWSNKLRRPLILDAKADYLLYGMADNSVVEFAKALEEKTNVEAVRGLCYVAKTPKAEYLGLPSFAKCQKDPLRFMDMFDLFYHNNDPVSAKGLCQEVDGRYVVQNPPAPYLSAAEMDAVAALPFTRDAHPSDAAQGEIRALDTIRFSLSTHQGCYGECNFCAISVHQGRTVRSRSEDSIVKEASALTQHPKFKGIIHDVGGPTANMYGFECAKKLKKGTCEDKTCLFPFTCKAMPVNHGRQITLLQKLRALPNVRKAFIASGIRYDLIAKDRAYAERYLKEVLAHHISGQMKVAPEHIDDEVLALMGKPGKDSLVRFKALFDKLNPKKQFLTYYLIAAHPGCEERHMHSLKSFASTVLKMNPEQAQIFIPTPSTYSTLMYYTGRHYLTRKPIFVEKEMGKKERQKRIVIAKERQNGGGMDG